MTIKELRKETGLSQSQFANHFEVPVRTLQEWEQGRTKTAEYIISMMERILRLEGVIHD